MIDLAHHRADVDQHVDHIGKDIRDARVDWFYALPAGRFKTFRIVLRAAYEGTYVLPSVVAGAMYEPSVAASTAAGTAVVAR